MRKSGGLISSKKQWMGFKELVVFFKMTWRGPTKIGDNHRK